jgi:hypothetical protein
MALDAKLARWTKAGLLTAEQADGIRRYEAVNDRPVALWAVIGIGLLALALGVLLVISANWDRIPAALKLGAHVALAAAAAVTVWRARMAERPFVGEAALFLLAALALGGIVLQAQVYQLDGPIWQVLAVWLLLMTPALLMLGQTRLTAVTWAGMLLWGLFAWVDDYRGAFRHVVEGLVVAGPPLLLLLGVLPAFRQRSAAFANALRDIGIVGILAAASVAHFAWAERVSTGQAAAMAERLLLPAAVLAGAWLAARRAGSLPPLLAAPLTFGPLVAGALATALPHGNGWVWRFVGAIVFAVMWSHVAYGAHQSGWRLLFGVAVAAVAVRLFIVYFELFGSLATTGLGLIVAGALLIGLTLLWRRVMTRAQPA